MNTLMHSGIYLQSTIHQQAKDVMMGLPYSILGIEPPVRKGTVNSRKLLFLAILVLG